jgi:anti-anti-sigma factor
MPGRLELSAQVEADGVVAFVLSGQADFGSATELRSALIGALEQYRAQTVIVDLDQVTFADSSVLGVLISTSKAATAAGAALLLRNLPDQVNRMITTMGLDRVLDIEDPSST